MDFSIVYACKVFFLFRTKQQKRNVVSFKNLLSSTQRNKHKWPFFPTAVGDNAVGENGLGENAVGKNSVGEIGVGENGVGENAVGKMDILLPFC